MKKKFIKLFPYFVSSLALILVPFVAFAQNASCGASGNIKYIICKLGEIVNSLFPIVISLGIIFFIWGIIRYVIAGGEEAKKKGKDTIIYGIIGLVVIFGMWGIVNLVVDSLGITTGGAVPTLQPIGGATGGAGCTVPGDANSKLQDYLGYVTCLINNSIIPLIFALAFLMFIWGTVKFFLINTGEEKQRSEGKQFMIWGIIAFAVMLSVWGLVNILGSTFGVSTSVIPQVCPPGDNSAACQ